MAATLWARVESPTRPRATSRCVVAGHVRAPRIIRAMRPIRPRRGRAPALGKKPQQVIEQRFQIGPVALDYRCALYRAGLRLDLTTDQGGWLKATVRVKTPVGVHVAERKVQTRAGRRFTPWALDMRHVSFQAPASGHPDYLASEEDPFARAWSFALDVTRVSAVQVDDEAEEQLEQLRLLLGSAARSLVARCEPAAFAVARRRVGLPLSAFGAPALEVASDFSPAAGVTPSAGAARPAPRRSARPRARSG